MLERIFLTRVETYLHNICPFIYTTADVVASLRGGSEQLIRRALIYYTGVAVNIKETPSTDTDFIAEI